MGADREMMEDLHSDMAASLILNYFEQHSRGVPTAVPDSYRR
jgi:hypothetical protein